MAACRRVSSPITGRAPNRWPGVKISSGKVSNDSDHDKGPYNGRGRASDLKITRSVAELQQPAGFTGAGAWAAPPPAARACASVGEVGLSLVNDSSANKPRTRGHSTATTTRSPHPAENHIPILGPLTALFCGQARSGTEKKEESFHHQGASTTAPARASLEDLSVGFLDSWFSCGEDGFLGSFDSRTPCSACYYHNRKTEIRGGQKSKLGVPLAP